jgi:hypothetical protein
MPMLIMGQRTISHILILFRINMNNYYKKGKGVLTESEGQFILYDTVEHF